MGEGHAKFIAVLIVDDETIDYGRDFGAVFVLDKEVEMGERKASGTGGGCH